MKSNKLGDCFIHLMIFLTTFTILINIAVWKITLVQSQELEELFSFLNEAQTISTTFLVIGFIGLIFFCILWWQYELSIYILFIAYFFAAGFLMSFLSFVTILNDSHNRNNLYLYQASFLEALLAFNKNNSTSKLLNRIQSQFRCCGYNGPNDYLIIKPQSCCDKFYPRTNCKSSDNLIRQFQFSYEQPFSEGCQGALYKYAKQYVFFTWPQLSGTLILYFSFSATVFFLLSKRQYLIELKQMTKEKLKMISFYLDECTGKETNACAATSDTAAVAIANERNEEVYAMYNIEAIANAENHQNLPVIDKLNWLKKEVDNLNYILEMQVGGTGK